MLNSMEIIIDKRFIELGTFTEKTFTNNFKLIILLLKYLPILIPVTCWSAEPCVDVL